MGDHTLPPEVSSTLLPANMSRSIRRSNMCLCCDEPLTFVDEHLVFFIWTMACVMFFIWTVACMHVPFSFKPLIVLVTDYMSLFVVLRNLVAPLLQVHLFYELLKL
ncbi:hypothetical protein VPH35_059572 [Triticum aestivum]|uniref:Uncharacterized protein n=1 Tax=Aegilops tauschii subsp. strangulata TaxID=200361 RepID=A0A453ERZ8_AEGTS